MHNDDGSVAPWWFDPDPAEQNPRLERLGSEQHSIRRDLTRLGAAVEDAQATLELLVREHERLSARLVELERREERLILDAALTDYGGEA